MKNFRYIFMMAVVLTVGACEVEPERLDDLETNTKPIEIANPAIIATKAISIEKLREDGTVRIVVPLTVFDDSVDAVDSTVIGIVYNNRLVAEIDAADFYKSKDQLVVFTLNPASSGDTLTFLVTFADGSVDTYDGVISAESDDVAEMPDEEIAVGTQV